MWISNSKKKGKKNSPNHSIELIEEPQWCNRKGQKIDSSCIPSSFGRGRVNDWKSPLRSFDVASPVDGPKFVPMGWILHLMNHLALCKGEEGQHHEALDHAIFLQPLPLHLALPQWEGDVLILSNKIGILPESIERQHRPLPLLQKLIF